MNMRLHAHTPILNVIDSRGLPIRQVTYWRGEASALTPEARVSTQHYDGVGHLVRQCDARFLTPAGRANLTRRYSLSGAELIVDSVDAGWRAGLAGDGGQTLEHWDGRGSHWQRDYDEQLRVTAVRERTLGGAFNTFERLSYSTSTPEFTAHNQCGRLIRHDDAAGTVLLNNYSVTGEVVEQARRFLSELAVPDWPQPLVDRERLLEPGEWATTRSRFNALGALREQLDVKGNRQLFRQVLSGQLSAVQLQLSGALSVQTLVNDIRYSAFGQVQQEVAGNGVTTLRGYCPQDGRLQTLCVQTDAGTPLQALHYQYDPVGNVLCIEDQAQPIRYFANVAIEPISRFGYDTLYQLIEAHGYEAGAANRGPASAEDPLARAPYRQTYRYDPGGNLLELIHEGVQSHSHRLVAAANSNRCLPVLDGVEPTEQDFRNGFDGNGNGLQLQLGQTLSWDLRNQLREVQSVVRPGGINDHESFVYGSDGMRVRKVSAAQASGSTVVAEVRYWPGLEIRTNSATGEQLQVLDIQAGRARAQVLHWESGQPTSLQNDSARYIFADHLGSCALELDSQARVINRETYHPFGTTAVWERGDSNETSFRTQRYSGKERDATGLYYYGLRYYVPWLQRWLNPDPAGSVDGLNHYRMVRNNPLVYRDVSGLAPEEVNAPEDAPTAQVSGSVVSATGFQPMGWAGFFAQELLKRLQSGVSVVSNAYRYLYRSMAGTQYEKSVTLNYPDFTIKQFELHSPSSSKDLMIQAHGRLQSKVHQIHGTSHELLFYTPENQDLSAAANDMFRFQSRKVDVEAVETIKVGGESRDYKLMRAGEVESSVSAFFHQGQLLNPKPEIHSLSDVGRENFHDVLTIKPGKEISLSKVLKQLPSYNKVHCFFCRSRNQGGQAYAPFSKQSIAPGD